MFTVNKMLKRQPVLGDPFFLQFYYMYVFIVFGILIAVVVK